MTNESTGSRSADAPSIVHHLLEVTPIDMTSDTELLRTRLVGLDRVTVMPDAPGPWLLVSTEGLTAAGIAAELNEYRHGA
jgi:hypothetical protein